MPLDPVILQNQALLRSFKEAAQEPVIFEDLPGAHFRPSAISSSSFGTVLPKQYLHGHVLRKEKKSLRLSAVFRDEAA